MKKREGLRAEEGLRAGKLDWKRRGSWRVWWCWLFSWLAIIGLLFNQMGVTTAKKGLPAEFTGKLGIMATFCTLTLVHICCSKKWKIRKDRVGLEVGELANINIIQVRTRTFGHALRTSFFLFPLPSTAFLITTSPPPPPTWSCCTAHERSSVHTNVAFNLDVFMGH